MEVQVDKGQQNWGTNLSNAFFGVVDFIGRPLAEAVICITVGSPFVAPFVIADMYREKSLPQQTQGATDDFKQLTAPSLRDLK